METLACGHVAHPGKSRACPHLLRPYESGDPDYYRLLTGVGLEADLICPGCDAARSKGEEVTLAVICEGCAAMYDDDEAGSFAGWRGEPGIAERPEAVDTAIVTTSLPRRVGAVQDIAAIPGGWLILDRAGRLFRFDPETGAHERVARTGLRPEKRKPHLRQTRMRLHTSADGRFAAVVNDYGRHGEVLDLATGAVTMELDGGEHHTEHQPFPVAFTGGTVVHRRAWNRLDASDAATGRLLTAREFDDDRRPGYAHGALHPSPGGHWLAEDGWVFAPAGVPEVFDLRAWLAENPWESDDGRSRRRFCQRTHYWDVPMCWIGDNLFAISGLGAWDDEMIDGVRIFDAASGAEVHAFAGPRGALFSASRRLYAAAPEGLEIWDPFSGERPGRIPGFRPAHHHRAAGELAEIRDGELLRWRIHERLLEQ
ncbi:hypothetical protein AB0M02_33685 [Actinoplanes sp. NPDC051861]|uniref:hypothetical protein n=1 Tax=Actinoplanes sp. NPDC051861 TaxID=3155170 RepID=UPI0034453D5E